ncbi:glycosyltransferase family 39 protein [Candidatus Daviesbacteria bacterium]|nr:glycosyltransferase family 39 protein [Candidatus Daviesbacteria bacterium]
MFLKFAQKFKPDIICLIILSLTIPIFFYKLGQSSLVSWDEAWYATIARNIAQTGDFLHMKWNGEPYLDHPPFGFWLTALIFKIFGTHEFWARFSQAAAGLGVVYLVYFLGKKLFNRLVGLISALALSSAFWFVYRARSGNLDILLTLFFLLSFYLALQAYKNQKFLPLCLSLIGLFLTKTIVPLAIIPSLIIILWSKMTNKRVWKYLGIAFLAFFSWWIYQVLKYPAFLNNFFSVGLRGVQIESNYLDNFLLAKTYLHNGIGRWFWPGVLGVSLALILRQKRLLILAIFIITFLIPVAFSHKVHIWHLIPLYPFLILGFFGGAWALFERFLPSQRYVLFGLIIVLSLYIYAIQIRQVWYQIIDIPRYISDEAILSREAAKYPQILLTDGDFNPAATFYSGKNVHKISRYQLANLFNGPESFLLITNDWRLQEANINPQSYQLIKKDRDKVLVLHQ